MYRKDNSRLVDDIECDIICDNTLFYDDSDWEFLNVILQERMKMENALRM